MKQILRDNALESWAMAIKYADEILEGKATLANRKHFVASLENAIELFIKQYMLNQNDYRVAKLRELNADGEPMREYLSSIDLNSYFENISFEKRELFYSAKLDDLIKWQKKLFFSYYDVNSHRNITTELNVLKRLRNCETHFFIDESDFLLDKDFESLYNMMIKFYEIMEEYDLLPFWGSAAREYKRFSFERNSLKNFSYEKRLMESDFVKKLKSKIENQIFPVGCDNDAYSVAENIVSQCECFQDNFDEVWSYVQMLQKYKRLKIYEVNDEISNAYCDYVIV